MGLKPVHNLIIAITPPDARPQTIVSMTVPEPGANRLTQGIAGILHETVSGVIRRLIMDAFAGVDEIMVNPPIPVNPGAPEGVSIHAILEDDLIDIAEGRKVVVLNDGKPVIMDAQEAADHYGLVETGAQDGTTGGMFAPADPDKQDQMSGAAGYDTESV